METLLKILHTNVPEVFEAAETQLSYEQRLPENEWNEEYYYKLTYWWEDNFAESRLDYIKKVGQKVFGQSGQEDAARQTRSDGQAPHATGRPTKAPGRGKKWLIPLIALLAVGAVLVLVFVILRQAVVD